jgi:hypothetical protein
VLIAINRLKMQKVQFSVCHVTNFIMQSVKMLKVVVSIRNKRLGSVRSVVVIMKRANGKKSKKEK